MIQSRTDTYKLIYENGVAIAILGKGAKTETVKSLYESEYMGNVVNHVVNNSIDIAPLFKTFDFNFFDFTIDLDYQISLIEDVVERSYYEKLKKRTLADDLPEIELLKKYIDKVKV